MTELSFSNVSCKKHHGDLISEIQDIQPDIVILHNSESDTTNILTLTEIRQHFSEERLAIIVHSVNNESQQMAWSHKICDYIQSSVNVLELKSRLIFHIHNVQQLRRLQNFENMMKRDIQSALSLQYSLMPQKKTLNEIHEKYQAKVNYLFKPCQYLSGDLWGILPLDQHRFGVWICDFVSKGLHAALSTFRIHTLIKDQEKYQLLNNKLKNLLQVGNFATFLYGVVDMRDNTFTYAAAGSTSPIFYNTKTKSVVLGDSSGLPLGIDQDITYEERVMTFDQNTSLLFYSDLLWECLEDWIAPDK